MLKLGILKVVDIKSFGSVVCKKGRTLQALKETFGIINWFVLNKKCLIGEMGSHCSVPAESRDRNSHGAKKMVDNPYIQNCPHVS
jgi:hypothetical protein